jgi:L-amino acid N-acyltransferase YncA
MTELAASTVLRRARPDDASAIAAIYNDSVLNSTATFDTVSRSEDAQRDWLDSHDARHPVLVAEVENAVVAWASLSPWSDRCAYERTAEASIYVEREWQGRGIGRSLLRRLLEDGRAANLHTVLARVAEGNEASLRLFEAMGFRRVGTMHEVGRKFDRFVDVHLLERILDAES